MGIDWFRGTGAKSLLPWLKQTLDGVFGPPQLGKGLYFFEASYRYANGAILAYDIADDGKGCCIDLPGQALAGLGDPESVLAFLRQVSEGVRCSRIDIRIDWQTDSGGQVGLLDRVEASCERGELCRCRTWKPVTERTNRGDLTGRTLYLGKRGKEGSGRYVRVYDKGLESGQRPAGEWERWEAEFSGKVAADVAQRVLRAEVWQHVAAALALGAVDFREVNGSTALARRPRAAWWSDLLASLEPVTAVERRPASSLERMTGWLHRCVLPNLKAMAERRANDVRQVLEDLGWSRVRPPSDADRRPLVWQYARQFCGPSPALVGKRG